MIVGLRKDSLKYYISRHFPIHFQNRNPADNLQLAGAIKAARNHDRTETKMVDRTLSLKEKVKISNQLIYLHIHLNCFLLFANELFFVIMELQKFM